MSLVSWCPAFRGQRLALRSVVVAVSAIALILAPPALCFAPGAPLAIRGSMGGGARGILLNKQGWLGSRARSGAVARGALGVTRGVRCSVSSGAVQDTVLAPVAEALSQPGGLVSSEALKKAVGSVTIDDLGTAAAGWSRCIRPTRVTILSTGAAAVSVLLLPAGERVPEHDRPGGEFSVVRPLMGSVEVQSWSLGQSGDPEAFVDGAGVAPKAQEVGFHKGEDDCVCRGGMCPRREGCKFWVELMQERLASKGGRYAVPHGDPAALTAQSDAHVVESGRGHVAAFRNTGEGVAALLEVVYGGGIDGEGTEETPEPARWYKSVLDPEDQPVMSLMRSQPPSSPGAGVWTGPGMAVAARGVDGTTMSERNLSGEEEGGGGEAGGGGGEAGGGEGGGEDGAVGNLSDSGNWADFLAKIGGLAEPPKQEPLKVNLGLGSSGKLNFWSLTVPGAKNGALKTQQDRMSCGADIGGGALVFGVYDGHGRNGHDTADFLKGVLPTACSLLPSLVGEEDLVEEQVDAEIKSAFETVNGALFESGVDVRSSGSTALVAVLKETAVEGTFSVVTANVGDCRAVVGRRDGGALRGEALTRDHRPGDKEERARVVKCGGGVGVIDASMGDIIWLDDSVDGDAGELSDSLGVPNEGLRAAARVFVPGFPVPGLSVARTFGDATVEELGVHSVPEVRVDTMRQGADQMLIVGSDGLWEVIGNQESVDIVAKEGGGEKGGVALIQEAVHRWSQRQNNYRDDISAVLVEFDD